MDLTQLFALIAAHKWVTVAAVVIGLVVRLLKSDGPIPIEIPSRWRGVLAVGLGVVSGVLEHAANGQSWNVALLGGLVAALTAISGHELVIEGVRNGKEIPLPGSGSVPPAAGAAALLCLFGLVGCSAAPLACPAIHLADLACETLTVTYPEPDGGMVTVRIPKAELEGLARATAAKGASLTVTDGGAAR